MESLSSESKRGDHNKMKWLLPGLMFITMILSSCALLVEDKPVEIEYINPKNNQKYVSLKPSFIWRVKNADINDFTFDLYLSQNSELVKNNRYDALVKSGIKGASYSLENELEPGKTYFWKIVAHHKSNEIEGPIWRFTTVDTETSTDAVLSPKIINNIFTEGGPYYNAFVLDDGYIVALTEYELVIYSIDDDRKLRKFSSFSKDGFYFKKMIIGNGFAYIFGDDNGADSFCVVDLSDISNPAFVSEIDLKFSDDLKELTLKGNYVYANFGGKISVIDVKDPENPELVKELKPEDMNTDYFENMRVYGDRLYIKDISYYSPGGILVFNITDPASPEYAEWILSGQEISRFDVNQQYLFVVLQSTLTVYDRENHTKLSAINLENLEFDPENFSVGDIKNCGDHVFITLYDNSQADTNFKMIRVDVSDPLNPVVDGKALLPVYYNWIDFSCSERFVLVPDKWNGLVILSNLEELVVRNVHRDEGYITDLELYKDSLIVSSKFNDILIYDLQSSPTLPEVYSHFPKNYINAEQIYGYIEKMVIKDDILYSVTGAGFFTLDITDPSNPKLLGSLQTPGIYHLDIVLKDNYAYTAGFDQGLVVLDVSSPESPFIVTKIDLGEVRDLTLDGTSLYASVRDKDEIVELDITDPASPKIVRTKFLYLSPEKLLVVNDKIYVAISDWRSPMVISIDRESFEEKKILGVYASNFKVFGNHLYVLGDKIYVVDTNSNELIHAIDIGASNITDIDFYSDYVYISTFSKGLFIVRNDFECRR